MRKRTAALLSVLLALALLCGCAGRTQAADDRDSLELGSFDEIEYIRPDTEELRRAVAAVSEALENGSRTKAVMDLIDVCYEVYYSYYTMYSVADIRSCQDLTDAYYAAEYAWCSANFSVVQQLMEDMYYACGMSAKAKELELWYFWDGFAQEYAERGASSLTDEVVNLMQRESELIAQYRELTAAPTIELDGEELDYYSYIDSLYDQEEYARARLLYYEQYYDALSELYIRLVAVRQEMALRLGFESYERMQYDYYFERDYSPEEAAGYMADIKEHMVPFYIEVMEQNPYARVSYDYLSERRLHRILSSAAANMGGDIQEAFSFMSDHGLYDISLSPVKAAMSFEAYLADYEAPFLFLDPYGDMEDVLSFSHEFGHYVDAYVNYDAYETIDVAECFSQAMEYLMLSYYGDDLDGTELENLYRMKMLDTLELYVQQASFAEFEQRVYAMDPAELSGEFLYELSLQLAMDYGYYDGESEAYYAMSWMDIVHFFEMPFYVVTYPISNDAAMQIYELEQQQEGAGLEKYLELLPREYDGLIDTLTSHGLESPFEPGRIVQVVRDLRPRLTAGKY